MLDYSSTPSAIATGMAARQGCMTTDSPALVAAALKRARRSHCYQFGSTFVSLGLMEMRISAAMMTCDPIRPPKSCRMTFLSGTMLQLTCGKGDLVPC